MQTNAVRYNFVEVLVGLDAIIAAPYSMVWPLARPCLQSSLNPGPELSPARQSRPSPARPPVLAQTDIAKYLDTLQK